MASHLARAGIAATAENRYRGGMAKDMDRDEAQRVINELRASADRLIKRSRELAKEARGLKQRADDLAQLIRQRESRKTHAAARHR
jgi:hypothetical protein